MSVRIRPLPIFLLGAALVLLPSSAEAQKAAGVTLQILPADSGAQPGAPFLLAPGQRAWVKLKAVDAQGRPIDLKETPVTWQSSNLELVQVRGKGAHAVAVATAPGQVTITATALEQTAALAATVGSPRLIPSQPVTTLEPVRSPVAIRASPPATSTTPVAPAATASAPVAVAKLDAPQRMATRDLATRNLCASGTPDPSFGQPCIQKVMPESAAVGMAVWVKGTGFTGATARFGTSGQTWSIQSDTLFVFVLRQGVSITGEGVTITNSTSGRSSHGPFKLVQPRIVSFWPKEGRAGDRVIISGYGFSDPPGVLFADGKNVAANEVVDGTGNLANAYVPPGDVTGHLMISGMVSADEFVELATFDPPTSPTMSIPPTGEVTIRGKALQNVIMVDMGSQPVPIVSKSYTSLTFKLSPLYQQVPYSVHLGRANVTYRVSGGGDRPAYAGPDISTLVQPVISALVPDSGSACGVAEIQGIGLINDPSIGGGTGNVTVQMGPATSPSATGSNTKISFYVPQMATTGPVTVKGYNQQVTSPMPFRIVPPKPTASVQGGSSIQVGQHARFMGRLLDVTKVSFTGGVELTQGWTASPIYNSGSCQDLLDVEVPQGAQSGPVTFTNPAGTATSSLTITP